MLNPSQLRHVAKITRPVTSQAETGGDTETVFVDVVPRMRVMVKTKRSEEMLKSGGFRAFDTWEIWFQNPGYTVQILQGDHITVDFRTVQREFVICGYYPPNDDRGDFRVDCDQEVARPSC